MLELRKRSRVAPIFGCATAPKHARVKINSPRETGSVQTPTRGSRFVKGCRFRAMRSVNSVARRCAAARHACNGVRRPRPV